VSTDTPYRDLEGPIFGDRVGIYHAESELGPWSRTQTHDGGYRMILYKAPDSLDADLESDVKTLPRKARKDLTKVLEDRQTDRISTNYPQLDTIWEDDPSDTPEAKRPRVEQAAREIPVASSLGDRSRVEQAEREIPSASSLGNLPLPEERVAEDPNAEPIEEEEDMQEIDENYQTRKRED
jgi:hypothetical protein